MMPLDFVPLWTLILGFGVFMYVLMDGFDLGVGILFRRAPSDARPRPHDELGGADLGRQRDLARPRRRRAARRLPARLRHHPAGALLPDPDHADGAHLPRRRLRVALQGVAAAAATSGTRRSTTARSSPRSRKASCSAPSCRGSGSRDAPSPAASSTGSPRSRSSPAISLTFGYALLGATWLIMKTEGELAGLGARAGPLADCRRRSSRSASSACGRRFSSRASRRAGFPGPTSRC